MAVAVRSSLIQITNVSPSASSEQVRTLFGHIGTFGEFVMYPPDGVEEPSSRVLEFFNKHTEVRCVRMAGTDADRAAYVEFTNQPSITKAFSLMGATLNGRQIMIQHSTCAIIKPANSIGLVEDPSRAAAATEARNKHKYRSRSRSRDRRSRSHRRSTSRRRHSRSRDKKLSPSRERRRSRDRREKIRSRTRSRSHGRKRHSRSSSRERRRGNRGRSRSRERRKYHRSRSRSGKYRSRSRGRRDREKNRVPVRDEKHRIRDRRSDKDYDKEKYRDKERDRGENSRSERRYADSLKADTTYDRHNNDTSVDAPSTPPRSVNEDSINRAGSEDSRGSRRSDRNASSPSHQNGKYRSPRDSDFSSNRPIVLGVKLAGPEDMDPPFSTADDDLYRRNRDSSPGSRASGSSGDEMDTEA